MKITRTWKTNFDICICTSIFDDVITDKDGCLGTGGNARVYYVKEKTTNEYFALKELMNFKDGEKQTRFLEEINIVEKYSPSIPGILPIIKSNKDEFWYTMPIADSITTHIKGIDEEKRLIKIIDGFIQLAETLELLHNEGISHRDIKPDNISFYNNRFCFGDFGLVDFPDNENNFTKDNRGLGAIFTMAPEMKRNPKDQDGKKADIYSLAKTLWMLITNNEKGFDGRYNFLDKSHSLRSIDSTKNVYTVEIEDLLVKATSNDPLERPLINKFKRMLQKYLTSNKSKEVKQHNQWQFLQQYLFGTHLPESTTWSNIDTIIKILNSITILPVLNHMFLSSKGGLDFVHVEKATEAGCILINADGYNHLVKPKYLHYESFSDFRWNYFLLELDELSAILDEDNELDREYLIEDYPAHYVSSNDAVYGVYDYDTGVTLPVESKEVVRYKRGKLLITSKFSPYNLHLGSSYDGRHGDCSKIEFRKYTEKLIELCIEARKNNISEANILNHKIFIKNPFKREEEFKYEDENLRNDLRNLTEKDIKTLSFKNLVVETKIESNIRFAIYFDIKHGSYNFSDLLTVKNEYLFLYKDGFFRSNEDIHDEICYVFDRDLAKNILIECEKLFNSFCYENDIDNNVIGNYFDVKLEKVSNPAQLFTHGEIKALMRNADDRKNNRLVIDENGYAKIITDVNDATYYPVSFGIWGARNNYVGKYSSLDTSYPTYVSMLHGFLRYLQQGRRQTINDDIFPHKTEVELISEIKSLQK